MRKLSLSDGIGLVAVVTAIAWLPGAADPLTYIKLLFLVGGGLALAPAVVMRWKALGRPTSAVLLPAGAALLVLVWGLISTFASGAPLWSSVFGWWGRGDGWLAWLGAAVLLLGATTLTRREVARAVTWLLGGATIVAFIGVLQIGGVNVPEGASGQVSGTMGNTNFAAGYFAILASLALGRALTQAVLWQRIWGGVLFVILAFLAWETHEDLCHRLNLRHPASVYRRNVITRGIDLNEWIGVEFEIQGIRFEGTEEASPCYWMNTAFGPGAEELLKGRGGLRARILSSGILRRTDAGPSR